MLLALSALHCGGAAGSGSESEHEAFAEPLLVVRRVVDPEAGAVATAYVLEDGALQLFSEFWTPDDGALGGCSVENDRFVELPADETLRPTLRDVFELVGGFSESSAPDLAPDQVGDCPGSTKVQVISFVDAFDLSWFAGEAPDEVEALQSRLRGLWNEVLERGVLRSDDSPRDFDLRWR